MAVRIAKLVALGLVLLLAFTFLVGSQEPGYKLRVVMDNAASLTEGGPVLVNGQESGSVTSIDVRDGKAVVDLELEDSEPLHAGTNAMVDWKAVLGERVVELVPGPEQNAEIPSGGMVPVKMEQVNVDDVLAALDPKTRKHVAGLVQNLDASFNGGSATDLRSTIKTAGPAMLALGEVLAAAGDDGDAIRRVVTDLHKLVTPLAQKDERLGATVDNLTALTTTVAKKQKALGDGLKELPSTLDAADRTLEQVGPAVDEAQPLLQDLSPVADRLTPVSQKLETVLTDLRPAMASLRPVVGNGSRLLRETPDLLDSAHSVVPQAGGVVDELNPAVKFLRPYTPDLVGWLANWGSAFGYYDSSGHYAGAIIRAGVASVDENPGLPLTVKYTPEPAPGLASGDPWTDANGSEMR